MADEKEILFHNPEDQELAHLRFLLAQAEADIARLAQDPKIMTRVEKPPANGGVIHIGKEGLQLEKLLSNLQVPGEHYLFVEGGMKEENGWWRVDAALLQALQEDYARTMNLMGISNPPPLRIRPASETNSPMFNPAVAALNTPAAVEVPFLNFFLMTEQQLASSIRHEASHGYDFANGMIDRFDAPSELRADTNSLLYGCDPQARKESLEIVNKYGYAQALRYVVENPALMEGYVPYAYTPIKTFRKNAAIAANIDALIETNYNSREDRHLSPLSRERYIDEVVASPLYLQHCDGKKKPGTSR
jgi:hypothetical protein